MSIQAICIGDPNQYGGGIRCFSLMKEFSAWMGRGFNSAEEFMIWSEFNDDCKRMYADVMSRPPVPVNERLPLTLAAALRTLE